MWGVLFEKSFELWEEGLTFYLYSFLFEKLFIGGKIEWVGGCLFIFFVWFGIRV